MSKQTSIVLASNRPRTARRLKIWVVTSGPANSGKWKKSIDKGGRKIPTNYVTHTHAYACAELVERHRREPTMYNLQLQVFKKSHVTAL